jgi:hypothetical protein
MRKLLLVRISVVIGLSMVLGLTVASWRDLIHAYLTLNQLGIILTFVGGLLGAFSFGPHSKGAAYYTDSEGEKWPYIVLKRPWLFWPGITFLVSGFGYVFCSTW